MQISTMTWRQAWSNGAFKAKLFLGVFIMGLLAFFLPVFFAEIEQRDGMVLGDELLKMIPSYDVSLMIFIVLYGGILWLIRDVIRNPLIFLTVLWAYIFLCVSRIVTISLVPLDPPAGLVEMWDPLSIFFYHTKTITKDLFFSGHTSILCLLALCQQSRQRKLIGFGMTLLMGVLLLIQHVHYTVDVLAAPVFTVFFWYLISISGIQLGVSDFRAVSSSRSADSSGL
ncbi:hypothetical protein HQN84_31330 [Pedobacter steynii]|nr:hypothetical protein [Pedobacter steynii]